MGQTEVGEYGGYLLPMSLPGATQEPCDLIGEEVIGSKPSGILLLLGLQPYFYPQPDTVWALLVSMNIFAVGLMGDEARWFRVTSFRSSLTTPSTQNAISERSINKGDFNQLW